MLPIAHKAGAHEQATIRDGMVQVAGDQDAALLKSVPQAQVTDRENRRKPTALDFNQGAVLSLGYAARQFLQRIQHTVIIHELDWVTGKTAWRFFQAGTVT